LSGDRFLPSTNAYDWLGEGVYFWEYAPNRALDWATARCLVTNEKAAVIGATIRLGRCLNLLDNTHSSALVRAYRSIEESFLDSEMPRNTEFGAHYLDRHVIDAHCKIIEGETAYAYQTVRGCYPEGEPVYRGSKILSLSHVQISVRDLSCVTRVHLVQF
jgi:hypothetical protein